MKENNQIEENVNVVSLLRVKVGAVGSLEDLSSAIQQVMWQWTKQETIWIKRGMINISYTA